MSRISEGSLQVPDVEAVCANLKMSIGITFDKHRLTFLPLFLFVPNFFSTDSLLVLLGDR